MKSLHCIVNKHRRLFIGHILRMPLSASASQAEDWRIKMREEAREDREKHGKTSSRRHQRESARDNRSKVSHWLERTRHPLFQWEVTKSKCTLLGYRYAYHVQAKWNQISPVCPNKLNGIGMSKIILLTKLVNADAFFSFVIQ